MNKIIGKLVLGIIIAVSSQSFADDFRAWTESKSEQILIAKPIDKKIKGEAIQVQTKEGKKHWLQTSSLIEADQRFIKNWVKPVDHLSVRVVGFGKGYKTIEITANAGAKPMKVVTKYLHTTPAKTHNRKIPAGKTATYKLKVFRNYDCKAYAGKKVKGKMKYSVLLDHESHDNKTGL